MLNHNRATLFLSALSLLGMTGSIATAQEKGRISPPPLARLTLGKPEELGRPIQSVTVLSAQVTHEEGRAVLVVMTGGGLPYLNIVDLSTNTLLRSFPLPGASSCWGGTVLPDGSVYLLTFAKLYRYDPRRKQVDDLGVPIPNEKAFWTLSHGESGILYGGSYPNGKVFRYDPLTRKFDTLGETGQPYVRSTAYHDGTLYAGTGPTPSGKIIGFDVKSGAKQEIPLPKMTDGEADWVYGLDVRGGRYLFAYITFPNKAKTLRIFDLKEKIWCPEAFPGYGDLYVGPERDGTVYFHWKGHWQALDLATRKARALPEKSGSTYRGGGLVNLVNPARQAIASVNFDGTLVLTDPVTGGQITSSSVLKSDASLLQAMTLSADGKLYLSSYLGNRGAVIDTKTGTASLFPMGQGEGIATYGSRSWWGIYPGAHLYELSGDSPVTNQTNPREIYHIPDEQDRPFAMDASPDWLVAGTVPGYGRVGGSLAVQNRKTGRWQSFRNVVADQSIVSVAISGDKAYGSTSIHGGLGGKPKATAAKVFSWDLRAGKKIAETDLKLGNGILPQFIGRVVVGPDGLLWGVANGSVFGLDPETLKIKRQRVLYPDVKKSGQWRAPFVGFGPGGLLYVNPAARVTVIDPKTLDFRSLNLKSELIAVGKDGYLYYRHESDGARVLRARIQGTETTNVNNSAKNH